MGGAKPVQHAREGSNCLAWEGDLSINSHTLTFIKVYDVTKFLDIHPGGRDQLLIGLGRDSSVVFDTYHKEFTQK